MGKNARSSGFKLEHKKPKPAAKESPENKTRKVEPKAPPKKPADPVRPLYKPKGEFCILDIFFEIIIIL